MRIRQIISYLVIVSGCALSGCFGQSNFKSIVNEDPARIRESDRSKYLMAPADSWSQVKKVVVVILENSTFDHTIKQPNFSHFAKEGALLTNYFAITHPSQPNYIAFISGSTQNVQNNDNVDLPMHHLGDLLERAGKSWKAYGEDYPGNCFLGSKFQRYVRKHFPFVSFKNVQKDSNRCARNVNASEFEKDLKSHRLPDFSLYVPNQDHNGHDTGVVYSDKWFGSSFLPLIEDLDSNPDTLFIITFDEGEGDDNRIYTVFYGAGIQPGTVSSEVYSHFSLLRTIETIFGLPTLGLNDETTKPIFDIWKSE